MPPFLNRVIGLLFLLSSHSAFSELLTDSNLSFGRIAVTSNTAVSSVQMSRSGRASATNFIYILDIGTPGVYTLTDLSPYTVINLTANVPAYSASPIPDTQQLILTAVDMPASIKVGPAGNAQFTVGGVLETTGTGGSYVGPATYTIDLPINITY